jgi:hypothetical protein
MSVKMYLEWAEIIVLVRMEKDSVTCLVDPEFRVIKNCKILQLGKIPVLLG